MRFFGVRGGHYHGVQDRINSFRGACEERNIEYVDADALSWDFSNIPQLHTGDLLCTIAVGGQALTSLLLNSEVTTLYRRRQDLDLVTTTTDWSIVHQKLQLPIPRTVFSISSDRSLLRTYIETLGGFPVVLKTEGGSRGVGAIKVESWEALFSTVDLLISLGIKAILRGFIQAEFGIRAYVLGDLILGSLLFRPQPDDFRNAPVVSMTRYEHYQLSSGVDDICFRAVHGVNLDFAGVDLLVDREGNHYVLEVNYPCGFKALEDLGTPVARKVVGYMIEKSESANETRS